MTDRELIQQALRAAEQGATVSCICILRAALANGDKASPTCDELSRLQPKNPIKEPPDSTKPEPIAWIYQNANTEHQYLVWHKQDGGRNWTPLFTLQDVQDAILAEREACARVCESQWSTLEEQNAGFVFRDAIRALPIEGETK